ncbi:hypothetical protein BSKO_02909 [Bryopsis sp. KO-2023]|nr:hypothetical protein BSKO_02909 [Bryopsis sp. KO-2023]
MQGQNNAASMHIMRDQSDLLDEKLAGQILNLDNPHYRCYCVGVPFSKEPSIENRAFCYKCMCYVCDLPAKECNGWGDGTSTDDHCHAFETQLWSDLKGLTNGRCNDS